MLSEINELIEGMRERKTVYQFLQAIFNKPLLAEDFNKWRQADLFDSEHFIALQSDLNSQDLTAICEREKEQYLQLFYGPGHIEAPPWESVYRTKEQLLFGEPTLQLRKKLRAFQLTLNKDKQVPEDHIAIELEFMSYLIDLAIMAAEHQDEAVFRRAFEYQHLLLEEHLTQWVEPFTEKILKHATSPLYRGAAQLLNEWVQVDDLHLKEMKEVIGNE